MNLLVLDTALGRCSVGVIKGDDKPLLISEDIGRGHAERLFGMIEESMREAGLAYSDLDLVAATVGPGSFTGLRVGIAAARGLALATGAQTSGIGTLAALAETARERVGPKPVLATLDARRDEIYAQPFDPAGRALASPVVGHPKALLPLLSDGMVLAGSGAPMMEQASGGDTPFAIAHLEAVPDIAAVVRLARSARTTPDLKPVYVRAPDAKPQPRGLSRR